MTYVAWFGISGGYKVFEAQCMQGRKRSIVTMHPIHLMDTVDTQTFLFLIIHIYWFYE